MSTEIKSVPLGDRLRMTIAPFSPREVAVRIDDYRYAHTGELAISMPRADFLKAVADELDVIVVERSVIPPVVADGGRLKVGGTSWPEATARQSHEQIRADALESFALAEYLDANPPVDEAQVETLAEVILAEGESLAEMQISDLARRLVEKGVRVEVTP